MDARFNLNDPRFKKERVEMSKKKNQKEESKEEDEEVPVEEGSGEQNAQDQHEEADDAEADAAEEAEEEEDGDGNAEDDEEVAAAAAERLAEADESGEADDVDASSSAADATSAGAKRRAQLASSGSVKDKTGIVYLSRVPPGMKPAQLRHILGQYGEVGRLYLAPENDSKRKSRKKSGGTARKCFTEGWVEFKRRKVAKAVALTLNNQIMGGDRRAYYYYDMWNIKYLPGFKWHHLTEKIAYEKQMREKRLRTEISQVKRENNLYLERVEKARVAQKIADKRKKKEEKGEERKEEAQPTPAPAAKEEPKAKTKRQPTAEGTDGGAKAKKQKRPKHNGDD